MKRIAEALVECGMYVETIPIKDGRNIAYYIGYIDKYNGTRDYRESRRIDPFADTLPGRREADALMDFLRDVDGKNMLMEYLLECNDKDNELGEFDSRKATIKWCFERLEKKNG